MRDYILVYINGIRHELRGEDVFQPITEYIRCGISMCGTKVVCAEGDCGSCTVMMGRLVEDEIEYHPVNSCILYGYQVDSCHLVTVEGLKANGVLNPVQQTMIDCHGAQCGYCTPGFIVAMAALFDEQKESLDESDIKDGLTGNLCRCTGYESIIKAGLEVDAKSIVSVRELYPESSMIQEFQKTLREPVEVKHENKKAYVPSDLDGFVDAKANNKNAKIVSGGTDISVQLNKKMWEIETVISTSNVKDLDNIVSSETDGREVVEVGARVSLGELEGYLLRRHPDLDHIFWVFGSPQIRNSGTLIGNIANASPIADTTPFLFVMDAEIKIAGKKGERSVPIVEFYKGYKKLDLKPDEVISSVRFGLPARDEVMKLYKVSRRECLDISAFTAAIKLEMDGDTIKSAAIAYGGVGPMVIRMKEVEEFLQGKEHCQKTFEEAGQVARKAVEPISDVRGSRDYRLQLSENIMSKFYFETATTKEEEFACL